MLSVTVATSLHIDASITHSPRKSKTNQPHEVVNDCEERDDESATQTAMQVIETDQPRVDTDTRLGKEERQASISLQTAY